MFTNQTLPDPRIGILQRVGHVVYYACIDGEFPERDTVEGIMHLLAQADGVETRNVSVETPTSVPAKARKRSRHDYIVACEKKYPAWDDVPFELEIHAYTAREAEKQAREHCWREGISDRISGPVIVKARRAD